MSGSAVGVAEPLHLRLFIENVEVPVIGALVQANEGSPAVAQIEVVPANSGLHLAARSKVLLFFLDAGNIGLGQLRAAQKTGADASSVSVEAARALTGAGYNLLFGGELFSITYAKSGVGSRSLVLQCLDDSNNWDTSYLYSLNYDANSGESVVAGKKLEFLAGTGTAAVLDDIITNPVDLVRQIVQRHKAVSSSISGPDGALGGVLGILELIGGVAGQYIGITAWHTIQEARVRLIDQIATDSGKTAAALFDVTAFDGWLTNAVGNMGTVVSFRDIVSMVCQYIYYNVVPNPVAVYRPGSRDPKTAFVSPTAQARSVTIPAGTTKLSSLCPGLSPAKVAMVDKIQDVMSTAGHPLEIIAAAVVNAQAESGFNQNIQSGCPPPPNKPRTAAMDNGTDETGASYRGKENSFGLFMLYALGAGKGMSVADRRDPDKNIKRIMQQPGVSAVRAEYAAGERDVAKLTATWTEKVEIPANKESAGVARAKSAALLFSGATIGADVVTDGPITPSPPTAGREHLFTQYFRPDVWFVPPPACNVIFPEEVTALTFNRDMMRETTRFELSTFDSLTSESQGAHPAGSDSVTDLVYFAPVIEGVESLTSGGLGTAAKAFIYPHEKYSGIIPKMERISDLSFFAAAVADQPLTPPADATGGDSQIDIWAIRAATFTYLSYRYSARTLSVSMRFTPRLVCGYPALVIDRTAAEGSDDSARSQDLFSPNHFLGMVRGVSHALNQSGGSTSISMSHVRTHKPDFDDLFASSVYDNSGVLAVQVQVQKRWKYRIAVGASTATNHGLGTQSYDPSRDAAAFQFLKMLDARLSFDDLNLENPAASVKGLSPITWNGVAIKDPIKVVLERTEIKSPIDGRTSVFAWSSVEFSTRAIEEVIPLEEAIRPPWVDEEYANENIGALYSGLFGCKSIMDLYTDVTPGTVGGVKLSQVSVADVVEKIVGQYSKISQGGFLGSSFIRELTQRDFASLGQVIGSREHPGFYWQSCGDFTGLTTPDLPKDEPDMFSWMTGAGGAFPTSQASKNKEDSKVDVALDPRQGRREAAARYQSELTRTVALRG